MQSAGAGRVVARDSCELAQAISHILQAPDGSERMRLADQQFTAQKLAWNQIAKTFKGAYSEVISSSRKQTDLEAALNNGVVVSSSPPK